MKLKFEIDYNTAGGEAIYMIGSLPELCGGMPLSQESNGRWTVTIEISPAKEVFEYRYEVRRYGDTVRTEWGAPHRLSFDPHLQDATVHDHWKDIPSNKPFFASAFTESIFARHDQENIMATAPGTLEWRVDAPMIEPDMVIAICGSCEALGNRDPAKALVLNAARFPEWTLQIPISQLPQSFEYKFVLLQGADRHLVAWESTPNRCFTIPNLPPNGSLILSGLFFENPMPKWRGTGTAIPVFSLRSDDGMGVGDFADLKKLIDWAAATGQQFIQLLPINDTTMTHTWRDSYPYTTNSTFALHPMYLRLEDIGQLRDESKRAHYDSLRKKLNSLPAVDYEQVNRTKQSYLHDLFRQQGAAEMTSEAFHKFASRNDHWLRPYAAWCVLRDLNGTSDMSQWGPYAKYDSKAIDLFTEEHRDETDFVRWTQFHLDKQLGGVRDYAAACHVALKGDIPIGISRCSVDAWLYPELFNLDCTAGAPPDDFAILGQNWGFPTYRWDVMARDGYAWWKSRLSKMAEYFAAYRIDHLLGFFRIWQIPVETYHGLLGTFSPALPYSPEEMHSEFGFAFDRELMTKPYITDRTLEQSCGYLACEIKEQFLVPIEGNRYSLADGLENQRAIDMYFRSLDDTERNRALRNALMDMTDEVLFIKDRAEPGKYHPRILGQQTFAFKSLSPKQKDAYSRLYEEFFFHRHNSFWREKAMEKLPPLIDSTGMLSCAEDLGMIPACVPSVMDELKILSLEIQRMPKEPWVPFATPARYPYLSVCSTSTHDMPGVRQWWEEDPKRAQKFFSEMLHGEGEAPRSATPEICMQILRMNLEAPSMLRIIPLQDWMAIDGNLRRPDPREEQINVPADPHHYWRYRMHITLDRLLEASDFNCAVSELIATT